MGTYNQALNENIDNVKVNNNIGGGGGGGESTFTKELLYSGDGTSRTDFELSKPYTDFDLLLITWLKFDDATYNDFLTTVIDCELQESITNNELKDGKTNDNITAVWSSGNSYSRFKFTDTTHFTYVNANGLNTVWKVYGIKF